MCDILHRHAVDTDHTVVDPTNTHRCLQQPNRSSTTILILYWWTTSARESSHKSPPIQTSDTSSHPMCMAFCTLFVLSATGTTRSRVTPSLDPVPPLKNASSVLSILALHSPAAASRPGTSETEPSWFVFETGLRSLGDFALNPSLRRSKRE